MRLKLTPERRRKWREEKVGGKGAHIIRDALDDIDMLVIGFYSLLGAIESAPPRIKTDPTLVLEVDRARKTLRNQ